MVTWCCGPVATFKSSPEIWILTFFSSCSDWWYTYPSETYEFVNGKDDIPYMKWKIIHSCSSHHQPVFCIHQFSIYSRFYQTWFQILRVAQKHPQSSSIPRISTSRDHGPLNVPIEHHPTIRYMVYNGYYKVMSNIPKMGQLPTPGDVESCTRRCATHLDAQEFQRRCACESVPPKWIICNGDDAIKGWLAQHGTTLQ